MKTLFGPCYLASVVAVILTSVTSQSLRADTITIDFSGIPNNTVLSANNPYAGLVNLQAQAGYHYAGPGYGEYGLLEADVWTESGSIYDGVVYVEPASSYIIPPGGTPVRQLTSLTATFLRPITEVILTTSTHPWALAVSYTGVDGSGNPFTGSGPWPPEGSQEGLTMSLAAPVGGYITQLQLENWEYSPQPRSDIPPDGPPLGTSTASPSFALNELILRVPEPSTLLDRALLLLLLAIVPRAKPLVLAGRRERPHGPASLLNGNSSN
jgi:hypothetical protein